ncbi:MAG: hypothetical protein IPK79_03630 [Vampirovibrionales bacterium]|nr:hypothetical protein [Vampirovibrionales bacterium]
MMIPPARFGAVRDDAVVAGRQLKIDPKVIEEVIRQGTNIVTRTDALQSGGSVTIIANKPYSTKLGSTMRRVDALGPKGIPFTITDSRPGRFFTA